jgi:hypothetical protein
LSKLPLVIARDLLGTDIPWLTPFWIGTAALLFGGSYFWSALKPLRSMGWPWIIHVVLDFIIYSIIVMTAI